jgi:hypothetical protein
MNKRKRRIKNLKDEVFPILIILTLLVVVVYAFINLK